MTFKTNKKYIKNIDFNHKSPNYFLTDVTIKST